MADYAPAWIEIGGPLPRELVQGLLDCIRAHGLSDDFGGSPIKAVSADDLLELAQDADGHVDTLKLYDERAHNGQFDNLEWFLEQHDIGFDRHGDGVAEFSPEVVRFRPGWPAPTVTLTDGMGREMIQTEYIVEALQMLRAGDLAKAITFLAQLANEGVPPLQPLSFSD